MKKHKPDSKSDLLVWKETFRFLPPGGKRYHNVYLEADQHSVRIKVGRSVIHLAPCNDESFLQHFQRAIDAHRTFHHIANPGSYIGIPAPF